jgi:hypothetical protein
VCEEKRYRFGVRTICAIANGGVIGTIVSEYLSEAARPSGTSPMPHFDTQDALRSPGFHKPVNPRSARVGSLITR